MKSPFQLIPVVYNIFCITFRTDAYDYNETWYLYMFLIEINNVRASKWNGLWTTSLFISSGHGNYLLTRYKKEAAEMQTKVANKQASIVVLSFSYCS